MVAKIVFSSFFISQLDDLAKVLYAQKYFGFIEDVDHYIDKIYNFITNNIDSPITKNSPEKYKKYGHQYLRYKAHAQTFWFIFFDQKDQRFLINFILNNHSQDFPELL